MKNAGIILILMVSAVLCGTPAFPADQADYRLELGRTEAKPRIELMPDQQQFRISLDSVMIHADKYGFATERYQVFNISGVSGRERVSPRWLNQTIGSERDSEIGVSQVWAGSTLTLNNSMNHRLLITQQTIKGSGRVGRWAVSGEFTQEQLYQKTFAGSEAAPGDSSIRASSLEATESIVGNTGPAAAVSAKNYYLEAEYRFRPSFRTKLSYEKSVVEAIDQQEKLKVEGIVEANQNVVIKAGYKNESLPEIGETRAPKDTKVWTEFILKF